MASDNMNPPTGAALRIGVVGLGQMGGVFARNLLEDGHEVTIFHRNPERARSWGGAGARVAEGLADLAACEVVITSLPDDAALCAVALDAGGLVDSLGAGALHVSTSTVSPDLSRRLADRHRLAGQGFVAAPVMGNPDLARARQIFVLASGDAADVARASPVLERLGQRVFALGQDAGAANLMKLAGNVLTATTLESMGEVLALLRKGGVDQRLAFDVLTNSLFDSKVHRAYGGKIVDERYSPAGMVVPLAVKDMRLALAEAEQAFVPMPFASLVRDRLVGMMARGWQSLDWSALGLLAAQDAGLATSLDLSAPPEGS